MTKLYKVPRKTRIKLEGMEFNFYKIDGAYSYCTDDNGNVIHISASADVEILYSLIK
jgi:hypothetical protein